MIKNSDYSIELFSASSGHVSARLHGNDGNILHLHSLVKPEAEYGFFSEISIWGEKIVLLGSGLGYHVSGLEKLHNKKLLVIDYYSQCIDYCRSETLSKCTNAEFISAESLQIEEKVKKFAGDGHNIQIIRHPVSYRVNKPFYDSILQLMTIQKEIKNSAAKALVLTGRFFLQDELAEACAGAGLIPVKFNSDEAETVIQYESKIDKIIQNEQPDIILTVNMKGVDSAGVLSELTKRHGIPVAIWFVDDPRPIMLHHKQFIKDNFIAFCWEKQYLPFLRDIGFAKVEYLPLATDINKFTPVGPVFRYTKIGFVGSSMGQEFLGKIAEKFIWHKQLQLVVESVADMLVYDRYCDVLSEAKRKCTEMSIDYPYNDERNSVWFQSYIIHTASMIKRKRLIEHLLPRKIELFGDVAGWKKIFGNKVIYHPDIDYRTELASVYRGITVNVNSTSCQMVSAVNQRVFDIPACGGFVINDHQDDLFELFDGKDIVTYNTPEELTEKIDYYSSHETQRTAIVSGARSCIVSGHTVTHRLQKIISSL